LFAKACALKAMELPEETIAATLLDLNNRLCKPPLEEKEVRDIAHSAAAIAQHWRTPGGGGIMSLKGVPDERSKSLNRCSECPLPATVSG
ncbi:MAG: primase C-terminal domain-containing protein, partial [Dehalococcoidia bacterium]